MRTIKRSKACGMLVIKLFAAYASYLIKLENTRVVPCIIKSISTALFSAVGSRKMENERTPKAPVVAARTQIVRYIPVRSLPRSDPNGKACQTKAVSCDGAVPTEREIRQLMDRILNTEEAAIQELNRLFRPGVEFFLRRSITDGRSVEGLVEEVLRVAVLAIQTHAVKSVSELLSFAVRTSKAYGRVPSMHTVSIEDRRNVAVMRAILDQLPWVQRQIIAALYLDEKPLDEIALEFGVPADEVRKLGRLIWNRYQEQLAKPAGRADGSHRRHWLGVA